VHKIAYVRRKNSMKSPHKGRKRKTRSELLKKKGETQVQNYKTLGTFSQILHLFNEPWVEELSVTDVAKALDMVSSKASRMLATLEREKLFERNQDTGKYRLGAIFFGLGMNFAFHSPLRKIMRPHLELMAKEKGLTASFGIISHHSVIAVDRIENLNIDLITHRIGLNIPVHSTSIGKILMAYLPLEKQEEILASASLVKFTEATIVDPALLKEKLKLYKASGFATDEGETHEDLNCIAAPIKNSKGEVVAALNLMAERSRISAEELFKNADYLKEKALFISRQLGYLYTAH
jgi:DNA-binding IclR family transcriptional regulator